jgi:outer membrane protein assembly factor BamB
VTLFVPMSVVTGSSNNVYALDNDTGYVVWQRHFDAPLPAITPSCPGGITSAATRSVPLDASAITTTGGANAGRGGGYRSVVGEPGEGVLIDGRAGGPLPPAQAPPAGPPARGANPPAPIPVGRGGQVERIPGAPQPEGRGGGGLGRPSGVSYVISSDGMLHVVGLASGKDLQRPAPFVPANAKWSAPIAVGTTLYAATSGTCGAAPTGVWAIDLDSDTKPVVSWKTNGGGIIGAIALTPSGTLIAAIGPGQATGDGRSNAVVALDPQTLQVKDWFAAPSMEFSTGPTILRHDDKDIVAVATKDGRIVLLDAAALGGSNHMTPLFASKPLLATGAAVAADALAAWQRTSAAGQPLDSWILLPVRGRPSVGNPGANGQVVQGAVVAVKVSNNGGVSLETVWVSHDLVAPSTPIIVNGVVFALATGLPPTAGGSGSRAVLHAYDGATGKRLWNSGTTMTGFASPGSFWSGLGQVYIGAHDGTVYAFGFNDERRPTNTP